MALTSGERAALWRKRQREDPIKHAQYKQRERERNKKRKEKGEFKSVNEMTEREKRQKRRNWRVQQQNKRKNDKIQNMAIQNQLTPTTSPDHYTNYEVNIPSQLQAIRVNKGKKKKNLNRSKAYRSIFKLRIELNEERRLKEKYKKRYYRIKDRNTEQKNPETKLHKMIKTREQKSAQLLLTVIVSNIQRKYTNCRAAEKRFLKDLIYREHLLKKYRLGSYAKGLLKVDKRCVNRPMQRRNAKCLLRNDIEEFFEREDNSRLKAGKKSTITRSGMKRQRRLLNDTIKNLHKKYLFERKSRISYSFFASLKPFWVTRATEKDRETCLCKYHENPKLKLNKLIHEKVIENRDLEQLLEDITCSIDRKECMYRECDNCKGNKIKTLKTPSGKIVEWKVWRSRRIERQVVDEKGDTNIKKSQMTLKDSESGTVETLLNDLQGDIERLARHAFNINHQYAQLKKLKDNCKDEETIIHIDFSENYLCKYREEIQSVHFGASKKQISIHTGVAYLKNKTLPFATISDCLRHGPGAIWAHLSPVIQHLKDLSPNLKRVHFISDGPTTQYRSKTNFYLFSEKTYHYGFDEGGTWNFLESGHGKGAPDGIGAVIKRRADAMVNTNETDITCSADLLKGLRQADSKVKLFEVNQDDIEKVEEDIPLKIAGVPGTMKLHQVITQTRGEIHVRVLSCFCRDDMQCQCYNPSHHSFVHPASVVQSGNDTEEEALKVHAVDQNGEQIYLPEALDETLLDKYCIVEYDGLPYPGIVMDVDDENLEVKVMHRIGVNRFFWPMREDSIWYAKDKLVTMLNGVPEHVTGRHHCINPKLWAAVCEKMDL